MQLNYFWNKIIDIDIICLTDYKILLNLVSSKSNDSPTIFEPIAYFIYICIEKEIFPEDIKISRISLIF